MAKYCKQCGCYIPDNQTQCLACGYDEVAEAAQKAMKDKQAASGKGFFARKTASTAATAAAPQEQSTVGGGEPGEYHGTAGNVEWSGGESWRKAADMKREQRQQWERKWAETEHRRREMEEEFKRKQEAEATKENTQRRTSYRTPNSTVRKTSDRIPSQSKAGGETKTENTGEQVKKILTVLSYLGFMCFVPLIFYRDDDFSRFHGKQGLILFLFSFVGDILSAIPVIGGAFTLAKLYFIYKGMMNALSGKKEKLPLIGGILG